MHFCSSSFLPLWKVCTVEIGSRMHLWRLRMNAVSICIRLSTSYQREALLEVEMHGKALPYCDCQWMRMTLGCRDVWFVQCSVKTCSHENNPQAPDGSKNLSDLVPDPRDLERKKMKSTKVRLQKQERSGNLWVHLVQTDPKFKMFQSLDRLCWGFTWLLSMVRFGSVCSASEIVKDGIWR